MRARTQDAGQDSSISQCHRDDTQRKKRHFPPFAFRAILSVLKEVVPLKRRFLALLLAVLIPYTATAAPDLYMKDTPLDTGVEPNPDAGPMWVTEDIWVRN